MWVQITERVFEPNCFGENHFYNRLITHQRLLLFDIKHLRSRIMAHCYISVFFSPQKSKIYFVFLSFWKWVCAGVVLLKMGLALRAVRIEMPHVIGHSPNLGDCLYSDLDIFQNCSSLICIDLEQCPDQVLCHPTWWIMMQFVNVWGKKVSISQCNVELIMAVIAICTRIKSFGALFCIWISQSEDKWEKQQVHLLDSLWHSAGG